MANYDRTRSTWRIIANTTDELGRRRRVVRHHEAADTKAGRRTAELAEAALRIEVASTGPPSRDTFAGVAASWVDRHRADWSPRTTSHTEAELANHIVPAFGERRTLTAIDALDIETAYASWVKAGAAASTRRRRHGIVHAVFADAERLGLMAANPMRRVRPAGGKAAERDVPTVAEVRAIIEAAPTRMQRAFVAMAAGTGARRGSLLGLTWRHLDLDRGRAVFMVTKESKPYTVTIDAGLVVELTVLRREAVETSMALGTRATFEDHHVFTEDGGATAWWPSSASRVFRLAAEHAGLGGRFSLHALRHFHATTLLADGVPTKAVAGRLGCTEQNVIATYSHRVTDDALDARVASLFGELLTATK